MKKITTIIFIFSFSLSATEFCPTDSQNDEIIEIAKELEATCDWSIREFAAKAVMNECMKANEKDSSIRFRNSNGNKEIHFTQFGDTYDHQEMNVQCKNKKAYQARVHQRITQLEQEAYTLQRTQASNNRTSSARPSSNSSTPASPQPEKRKLWSCKVPNYIRTFRIVEEGEKDVLEQTYGSACVSYN